MMKNIVLLVIAVSSITVSQGQTMQGKRVLTTTMSAANLNFSNSRSEIAGNEVGKSSGVSFGLYPELTFGKVNSKNLLVAYGVALGYTYSRQKQTAQSTTRANTYAAGPAVLLQKFIPITEKIFYSPLARIYGGYTWSTYTPANLSKNTRWFGNATVHPLSIAFNVRPRSNVLMVVGDMGVKYSSAKSESDADPSVTRSSSAGVYATFNYFAFGYQRLF